MTREFTAFVDPAVESVFSGFPEDVRGELLAVRELIYETARETEGVGPLEEALRWGEPAYLTTKTKSGSLIRVNAKKGEPGKACIYFHCKTSLVDAFKALYPGFEYEGNRAIVLRTDEELPTRQLRKCISLALTYHLDRKRP